MKQPLRKNIKKAVKKDTKKVKKVLIKKNDTPKFGTSKLERDFARDFLDRYGIKYIYEFEAKDIKRFYDFAIVRQKERYITEEKEGLKSVVQGCQHTPIEFLIEIDGGYWHSDPRIVNEDSLNAIQKHNKMVDELKNKWASIHSLPLLRIWEHDIRHNPKKVLEELRKYVFIPEEKPIKKKRVMKLK